MFNVAAAPFIVGMDSPQIGILILGNRVLAELHGIGSVRLSRVNSSIVKKRVPKTSKSGTRGGSRRLPAQTALDDHVRARVKAFLADSLLSEEQFGQTVLGDPKFVPGLDKGRSMRLDAADRVLRFMGEFAIGPRFRREIEAFTTVTGTKRCAGRAVAAGTQRVMALPTHRIVLNRYPRPVIERRMATSRRSSF